MAINFRKRPTEAPDINLIPFIDVLLVILIFLILTTTYSKFTEIELTLPSADTAQMRDSPREVIVHIAVDGSYVVGNLSLPDRSVDSITSALGSAAPAGAQSIVIISADANAPHQAVVWAMEAAQRAGLSQITFAAQASSSAP